MDSPILDGRCSFFEVQVFPCVLCHVQGRSKMRRITSIRFAVDLLQGDSRSWSLEGSTRAELVHLNVAGGSGLSVP